MRGKVIDESIVAPACHIVEILDANDFRNALSLLELFGSHVAKTDMADESLSFEFSEHRERFLNRSLRWFHGSPNAEIDDIESLKTKISQVVVGAIDQLLAGKERKSRTCLHRDERPVS